MASEEAIAAVAETVENPPPEPASTEPAEEKPAAKTGKASKAKEPKAKKPAAPKKARTTPTHPPYEEVCIFSNSNAFFSIGVS